MKSSKISAKAAALGALDRELDSASVELKGRMTRNGRKLVSFDMNANLTVFRYMKRIALTGVTLGEVRREAGETPVAFRARCAALRAQYSEADGAKALGLE